MNIIPLCCSANFLGLPQCPSLCYLAYNLTDGCDLMHCYMSVCLSVCLYVCKTITFESTKFIFAHPVYLQGVRVRFVYEGHRVEVKVTGAVKVHSHPVHSQRKPACQHKCAATRHQPTFGARHASPQNSSHIYAYGRPTLLGTLIVILTTSLLRIHCIYS